MRKLNWPQTKGTGRDGKTKQATTGFGLESWREDPGRHGCAPLGRQRDEEIPPGTTAHATRRSAVAGRSGGVPPFSLHRVCPHPQEPPRELGSEESSFQEAAADLWGLEKRQVVQPIPSTLLLIKFTLRGQGKQGRAFCSLPRLAPAYTAGVWEAGLSLSEASRHHASSLRPGTGC